jgi:hypothetical protein
MDLPEYLEVGDFVSGMEQKKQEIHVLLRHSYGELLSDTTKGCGLSEHTSSSASIYRQIQFTMEQIDDISGVTIDMTDYENGNVVIYFTYLGVATSVVEHL